MNGNQRTEGWGAEYPHIINQLRMLGYQQPSSPVIIITAIMAVEWKSVAANPNSSKSSKGLEWRQPDDRREHEPTMILVVWRWWWEWGCNNNKDENGVAVVLETKGKQISKKEKEKKSCKQKKKKRERETAEVRVFARMEIFPLKS